MWAWCGDASAPPRSRRGSSRSARAGTGTSGRRVAVVAIALGALAFSVYIVYLLEIVKLANPRVRARRRAQADDDGAAERVTVLRGGTVTFVFTDIEGSTELLKQLGDRYAEVARRAPADHPRRVRAPRGQEIDTQGDAFFFSLRARPRRRRRRGRRRSVRSAEHDWPDGTALRVRMSLHTGEPVVGEEGYVGIDVHPRRADLLGGSRRPGAALGDDRGARVGRASGRRLEARAR